MKNMSKTKLRKFGRKTGIVFGTALSLVALAWPAGIPAHAQATTAPSDSSVGDDQSITTIEIQPGKAKKMTFDQRIKRANILAPDIADVVPLGPNDLLITAKKSGSTQLIVWDEAGNTQIMNVQVETLVAILQKRLDGLFPDSKIKVEDANGTLTLTGEVHDLEEARRAEELTLPYAGSSKIVDLMEVGGGQQVMLHVKFAEVSKQAEAELGFNFAGADGMSIYGNNTGTNPLGLVPQGTSPTLLSIPSGALSTASMFGIGQFAGVAFAYFVDALEQNSLLRTLSEPTLVTTSGEEASFLAGGSFPYPVPQAGSGGSAAITIQFQPYGVQLHFTPVVLGNGRIRMKVNPDVSELDFSHTVTLDGTTVPGLTDRNVDTQVEMAEGQTLALGGLLETDITASNSQFPILGDLPVIGALFRSVKYQKNETELVILVTPELVHGINPADVTPVPGEKWRDPSLASLYFLRDLGGEEKPPTPGVPQSANGQAPPFQGPAGFSPPPTTSSDEK
jgi:pilus assembly protein CpaC